MLVRLTKAVSKNWFHLLRLLTFGIVVIGGVTLQRHLGFSDDWNLFIVSCWVWPMWVIGLAHWSGLFANQITQPESRRRIWFGLAGVILLPLGIAFLPHYLHLIPAKTGIGAYAAGCLLLTPFALRIIWRCAEGKNIKVRKGHG
jgi:hypothetical protein